MHSCKLKPLSDGQRADEEGLVVATRDLRETWSSTSVSVGVMIVEVIVGICQTDSLGFDISSADRNVYDVNTLLSDYLAQLKIVPSRKLNLLTIRKLDQKS